MIFWGQYRRVTNSYREFTERELKTISIFASGILVKFRMFLTATLPERITSSKTTPITFWCHYIIACINAYRTVSIVSLTLVSLHFYLVPFFPTINDLMFFFSIISLHSLLFILIPWMSSKGIWEFIFYAFYRPQTWSRPWN